MAPVNPGDPQHSPRPEPIGNMPITFLFTTCTMCILFILWKRADSFRRVVSHQLKNITRPGEGRVRLSEDDGPPAREFLEDDDDDDHEPLPPPPHDRPAPDRVPKASGI